MRPRTRNDFTIAIICALPVEADAVEALFDENYGRLGKSYGKVPGDTNAYINGRIGKHNVVLCYLAGIGKSSAASAASSLQISYLRIELVLVVGVCGAAPSTGTQDICLGDVVISDAVVEYGFGRRCPSKSEWKGHGVGSPIRPLLQQIGGFQDCRVFGKRVSECLDTLKRDEARWCHPGVADILFSASCLHRHCDEESSGQCDCFDTESYDICDKAVQTNCDGLGCAKGQIVRWRDARQAPRPSIHVGAFASDDTVLKSGQHRDEIVCRAGVIGFDMEGVGVWDSLPCVIIKGVSDYADSHKDKTWQTYAAATGACAAKAFLECWKLVQEDG